MPKLSFTFGLRCSEGLFTVREDASVDQHFACISVSCSAMLMASRSIRCIVVLFAHASLRIVSKPLFNTPLPDLPFLTEVSVKTSMLPNHGQLSTWHFLSLRCWHAAYRTKARTPPLGSCRLFRVVCLRTRLPQYQIGTQTFWICVFIHSGKLNRCRVSPEPQIPVYKVCVVSRSTGLSFGYCYTHSSDASYDSSRSDSLDPI